jgi:ketosteroid isomerase-like protein
VSTPQRRAELAREAVDAYLAGDLDRVLGMMSPDVLVVSGPGLPESGRFRGPEEFRAWTGRWIEAWEEFDMEMESIEPVGKRHMVAGIRQRGRGRGSGVEVEMTTGHVYEFEDETLVYFGLHTSLDQAVEDATAREESGGA